MKLGHIWDAWTVFKKVLSEIQNPSVYIKCNQADDAKKTVKD